jgi:hypothetical protein
MRSVLMSGRCQTFYHNAALAKWDAVRIAVHPGARCNSGKLHCNKRAGSLLYRQCHRAGLAVEVGAGIGHWVANRCCLSQGRNMKSRSVSTAHLEAHGLTRRDFLKVGAGFSAALVCATVIGGCGGAPKSPAKSFGFLRETDLELFSALVPAVVPELAQLAAAERGARLGDTLHKLDASCAALDSGNQQELRKLLDLLAIAPLRYLLAGVGAWNAASAEMLQAFLARWRGSRFATLNAGGNVLVKLIATSYYGLPASWPASGYPGPLAHVYQAVNS